MASDQIREELDELRAQLEQLRQERESQPEDAGPAGQEGETAGEQGPEPAGDQEPDLDLGLMNQFRDLLDDLDEELKEVNPTTLLAVFALGIVVGRLLPR